jgi:hypothetical protein
VPAIGNQLYRSQAFAAHTAAIAQNATATLGGIARTKAMLTLASNFRWLILTFHTLSISGRGEDTGEVGGVNKRLSLYL